MSTVASLRPGTKGLSLVVQVVDTKDITERSRGKGGPANSTECIVGDETGVIVLVARKEQVELAKKGACLDLTDAKVEMQRGSMRLVVDSAGKMEVAEGKKITPRVDYNVSLIEFEMVSLTEAGTAETTAA